MLRLESKQRPTEAAAQVTITVTDVTTVSLTNEAQAREVVPLKDDPGAAMEKVHRTRARSAAPVQG